MMCFVFEQSHGSSFLSQPAPHTLQGVAENAEALAALAGGHDGSSELFLYFNKLCIQVCPVHTAFLIAGRDHQDFVVLY